MRLSGMRVRETAFIFGISLLASLAATDVQAGPRVALLPIGAVSETSTDLRGLEERLHAVVEGVLGEDLVPAGATQDLIESAAALGLRCHGADQGCLLKLAVLVELDQLLVPSMMLDDAGHHLHLALVDVTTGTTRGALLHRIESIGEKLDDELVKIAGALLAPAQYTGTLVVQANEAGATVRLDGVVVGETPLGPLQFVPAGDHLIVLTHGDERAMVQLVTVEPGRETSIVVESEERNFLEGRSVGFIGGLGLAALGGTVAIATAAGAIGADSLLYSEVGEYHEREAVKNTGVVLLLTSAASALTAAAGGALLWWAAPLP